MLLRAKEGRIKLVPLVSRSASPCCWLSCISGVSLCLILVALSILISSSATLFATSPTPFCSCTVLHGQVKNGIRVALLMSIDKDLTSSGALSMTSPSGSGSIA